MVERIIKVTSDFISVEGLRLLDEARKLESRAIGDYGLHRRLFDTLVIAPKLTEHKLGFFVPKDNLIVLSEDILDLPKKTQSNILKHELSHALENALTGTTTGHSQFFRALTSYFEIDSGFEKAAINRELLEKDKTREKIRKLMAMTTSPFENESITALKKAQKIMVEKHVELREEHKEAERLYFSELYESARTPRHITSILCFVSLMTGVCIIRKDGKSGKCSVSYGSLEQVEFSIYLFDYVISSLDRAMKDARKKGLKITKNSFIVGALSEMKMKVFDSEAVTSKELITICSENKKLAKRLVYQNSSLRTRRYKTYVKDGSSYQAGKEYGKRIVLPKEVGKRALNSP